MAATLLPPTDPQSAKLRDTLNVALGKLSDREFADVADRVKVVVARRAAAEQVRAMVDRQVRPELRKLTKRLRKDVELSGRLAAGRVQTRRGDSFG